MHDRDNLPDDVPVADAVEQVQQAVPPEPSALDPMDVPIPVDVPIEADPSDWQEQLQEVGGDDLDEYR